MRTLILLVLATTSCASHRKSPILPAEKFAVVIINHHWLDVTVYLVHDGQRTRVGTVTASTTDQFSLPARLLGSSRQIALIAEAVGSRESVRTEPLTLQPGEYVEWTLENALRRSSVAIY